MAVTFRFTTRGVAVLSVAVQWTWYMRSTTGDVADAAALAEIVRDRFAGNMSASISDGYTLTDIDVIAWEADNLPPLPSQTINVTNFTGADSGVEDTPRKALLCNFSSFTQKPNRKRVYLGAFSIDATTGGQPGATYLAEAQDFIDAMLASHTISGRTYVPVVIRIDENQHIALSNQLTSGFPSANWADLKTRTPGRGI